jgi:osmoprotectant transport system permease protein
VTVASVTVTAAGRPLIDWGWIGEHLDQIWSATVEHLQLTAIAVGLGFALAMAMALVSLRWRWSYPALAGFSSILYSIPSLALFGLVVPVTGLGLVPAEIALVGYTLLILLRNIVAGIDGVPAPVREAADGMGFEPWRRLAQVDIPLALPAIVAGLRIATVTTIGLVTITAYVGLGGYGDLIREGLQRQSAPQASTLVIVGTGLSVVMAVTFDLIFVLAERAMTPWARRPRRTALQPQEPVAVPVGGDLTAGGGGG